MFVYKATCNGHEQAPHGKCHNLGVTYAAFYLCLALMGIHLARRAQLAVQTAAVLYHMNVKLHDIRLAQAMICDCRAARCRAAKFRGTHVQCPDNMSPVRLCERLKPCSTGILSCNNCMFAFMPCFAIF